MKSKCLLLILWLQGLVVCAQRQADVIWAGNSFFCAPQEPPARNYLIVFNEDSLEYIDNDTPIILTSTDSRAAYSDRQGNFKFASNGWRLVNSFGEVLSYKLWSDDMSWPGGSPDTTKVIYSKGPLFLEDPGDSNKVFLLYGQYKLLQANMGNINKDVLFSYALLDVSTESIISFNHNYLTDTTSVSDAVAVRHGNGRDWWILKPGLTTNVYYRALLDPSGLSNMERIVIPGVVAREQTYTVSHFTQDGNKFIHFTGLGEKWVQLYDFDRCTGELSNPQETDLRPMFRQQDPCNFTISPDGTKFYAVRLNYNDSTYVPGTYQYDFTTNSFGMISERTGLAFLTPNHKEILFFTRLIPNTITNLFFSTISNPNALGGDCDVQYFKYEVLNFNYMLYAPSFANYRLGPIVGSPCDTLGLVTKLEKEQQAFEIRLYPNPSHGQLNVVLKNGSAAGYDVTLMNMTGALLYENTINGAKTEIDLRSLGLSSGAYVLVLKDRRSGQVFRRKVSYVE